MIIELRNLKPSYMSESEVAGSDIYLQPSVTFEQGKKYMICARSGHGKTSLLNFIYGANLHHDGQIIFHSPLSTFHFPLSTFHSPLSTFHFPLSTFHSPLSTFHSPLSTFHSPLSTFHFPLSTFHFPLSTFTFRLRHLSYLFQDLCLFPELTALENVQIKNSLTGHKSDADIEAMLDALLPAGKKHQPLRTLSLGQRQRVAAVRALCQPFEFLLLDEPFSHLDRDTAALVADMILHEVEAQHAALLLTTLDPTPLLPFDATLRL